MEGGEGRHIEAAALLSHVNMLETKLSEEEHMAMTSSSTFGHRKGARLSLCRIPDHNPGKQQNPILAMMAHTERCISAQVMRESVGLSGAGAPIEVLVVSEEDAITSAIILPLERPELTVNDSLVVADEHDEEQDSAGRVRHRPQQPKSLMSGGVVSVSPKPRLAIVVGTKSSRVISIEFSVQTKSMQLLRRNHYIGKEEDRVVLPYFELFPRDHLTLKQEDLPQLTADRSRLHRTRRPIEASTKSSGGGNKEEAKVIVPFDPRGGVASLVAYSVSTAQHQKRSQLNEIQGENGEGIGSSDSPDKSDDRDDDDSTYVWIGYGDGTGVRIHHAGLFPSVVQKYSNTFYGNTDENEKKTSIPSLEDILGQQLIKWHAHLPVSSSSLSNPLNPEQMVVMPIPTYHPTPLAAATNSVTPFPTSWNDAYQAGMMGRGINVDTNKDDNSASHEKPREDDWSKDFEAIVYYKNNYDEFFPTLAFYTSEDQYPGRFQSDLQELLYGSSSKEEKKVENHSSGLSNPIAAIVGGIFSVFGGGDHDDGEGNDDSKEDDIGDSNAGNKASADGDGDWEPGLPFPAINRAPIDLYAGVEIHDSPRQITECTIDPDGDLAALTDTLGRVSLIDLNTKQVIRMWKGFRETSCNWIQVPQSAADTGPTKPMLFLVIHSRQRSVVEVWQMTHGVRVKSMQVGREAQVIGCKQKFPGTVGYINTCYIAHSNVPFSNMNQVERIIVSLEDDDINEEGRARSIENPTKQIDSSIPSQEATARMNRLQQLLGETNVECQSVDVYKTLEQIESLEDLAHCLDTVAMSPSLEEKMGVDGSSFQRLALSLCQQKLDEAISDGGKEALTNPHVELLAFKIAYYMQICAGYEILHKYEMGNTESGNPNLEVKQPESWGLEAAGWTSTYLKITKEILDKDICPPPEDTMMFYEYASCLVAPKKWKTAEFDEKNGGYAVYLSDSTRTRKDIIARIFQPLVSDVFSFKVVNQVFDSLGIKNNYEYKLKCFGEWFVGLPMKKATKNAVLAQFSPSIRWLKEIVSSQIDNSLDDEEMIPMDSLYYFCRGSEDLIRAFWLAALCRQTIFEVATEKEGQTYGKVNRAQLIGRWDTLLRQLRVCLLVSLRLFGSPLGACPISVKAVDRKDNFSVFEWLARDELAMSHNQGEISSLEIACQISTRAFDPSKREGDGKMHWKTVQRSCLTAALGESERAEYLVDFDDDERLGALHLYLKPHNKPELLVAHRSLLLSTKWGRDPGRLDILEDAIVAMQAIDLEKHKSLAYAVILDVWQRQIRPIYRAMLFGFDDVQEISSDVITPLLNDSLWVDIFSKSASMLLKLLAEINFGEGEQVKRWTCEVTEDDSTWPPVRQCFILQRLVARNKILDRGSLEAHQTLVYALRINDDLQKLTECIPSFYYLFLPETLFNEVFYTEEIEEKQHEFMQDSIVVFAKSYHGPNMDTLNMGDIDALADLWDFDSVNVNTLFLLSMYEFGKDAAVDELLTKSSSLISVEHFVDEGLDIMCRRLNNLLNVNPSDEIREIMGTLDADICEWVKEKAEDSEPLLNAKFDVKIGSTHLFGLRLLSLAATADVSKAERIQIHSLIVLSGTIVKVLESSAAAATANKPDMEITSIL
eukprot:CAMPEP_0172374306 /NCGR_PEP_ID=MMETSP1060-20121228/55253_1 /TAXON_ID=37318 /ORGANISM="Pseudo-nitzschia pungens, Strain cf. cingulata" /LENGTH=1621 /DNA_ID=CAMNT_0013100911 /DNA_START=108 /DNA_END=4973 /DNA_ORIENTATION=+